MKKILILDDDTSVRHSLVKFFEDLEYKVLAVKSAEEALVVVEKEQIDQAIVDLRLPGISGDEFIQKVYDKYENMIFVIHSGSINYNIPFDFKTMPRLSDHVFQKPIIDLFYLYNELERLEKKKLKSSLKKDK